MQTLPLGYHRINGRVGRMQKERRDCKRARRHSRSGETGNTATPEDGPDPFARLHIEGSQRDADTRSGWEITR